MPFTRRLTTRFRRPYIFRRKFFRRSKIISRLSNRTQNTPAAPSGPQKSQRTVRYARIVKWTPASLDTQKASIPEHFQPSLNQVLGSSADAARDLYDHFKIKSVRFSLVAAANMYSVDWTSTVIACFDPSTMSAGTVNDLLRANNVTVCPSSKVRNAPIVLASGVPYVQSIGLAFARTWLPMDTMSMDTPFHGMTISVQYPDNHVPTLDSSFFYILEEIEVTYRGSQ